MGKSPFPLGCAKTRRSIHHIGNVNCLSRTGITRTSEALVRVVAQEQRLTPGSEGSLPPVSSLASPALLHSVLSMITACHAPLYQSAGPELAQGELARVGDSGIALGIKCGSPC